MEEVIQKIVNDSQFLLVFLMSIFMTVYASMYIILKKRIDERKKSRNSKFWNALSNGFAADEISTLEDVTNIYKGLNQVGNEDITYKNNLTKKLREYLVEVIYTETLREDAGKRAKRKITEILNQIETDDPFSDVPIAERNLILDIRRYIEHNENEAANLKLADLAGLIEVRQSSMHKLENANRWSVPLAIVGLIFTVFFGILSIVNIN